jgi:hypothetical protein
MAESSTKASPAAESGQDDGQLSEPNILRDQPRV